MVICFLLYLDLITTQAIYVQIIRSMTVFQQFQNIRKSWATGRKVNYTRISCLLIIKSNWTKWSTILVQGVIAQVIFKT